MDSLASELRRLSRRLSRSPLFTTVAVITLGVGIGANSAIFSVVRGVLLKPLPYQEPDRLVAVWQTAPGVGIEDVNASPATYFTYREEGRVFEDIGLWRQESAAVTGLAEPERVTSLVVTDGVLPVLRMRPIRGRRFTHKDDSPGSPETAMLGHGYWQRRFGGDDSVIGRRIMVDGTAREVIGVLPADFRFMNVGPDLVLPFRFDRNKVFVGNFSYQAVARLKPGASIAQANADVARMLPMMMHKFPMIGGLSPRLFESARMGPKVRPLKQDVVGDVGKVLWVLMATVGIVLLIACANVANLLLVRADGRQHELAIRAALGAGRWRIARELLMESVALGAAGGVLALGLAWAGLRLLVRLAPANLPRLDEIALDGPVLLFTLAISVFSGVLFGLLPVYKYAGAGLGLRDGGRTASESRERQRARGALVTAQVALAVVLLVAAGLLIRSLNALRNVHPGFTAPESVLTLRLSIPDAQVPEADRVARMHYDILQKIAAIPGVSSAAVSNSITMDGSHNNDPIFAEDRTYREGEMPPIRRFKHISPGLFGTLGNPVLAGRDFTWTDIFEKRPVAIVSENLAREYWRDPAAALGKRIRESPKGTWREIVGVVGNERDDGADRKAPAVVYWPLLVKDFWQFPTRVQRWVAVAVRSSRTGSAAFEKEVHQAIWSVNPELPVANIRTLRQIYDRSMARTSFALVMLAIAAGMALLLSVVGLYGVVSYSVSQRTREIGIRIALGAQQEAVRRMFLGHGLLLTGTGIACGLAATFVLTRLMAGLLFGVSPLDPMTYGAVSAALVAAALVATYVPARRATVIEPVAALRAE
jgi:predicted permease